MTVLPPMAECVSAAAEMLLTAAALLQLLSDLSLSGAGHLREVTMPR